jgi:hypothetical protein
VSFAALSAPRSGAGLVSVPTSDTPVSEDQRRIAVRERQAQRGCLMPEDAFKPDAAKLRVSRLRMNIGSAARLHLAAQERPGFRPDDCLMLTLTYRNGASGGVEWSPRHISECLKRIRQWMKRKGWPCRYVWVSELGEKSGRLHYHVALWVPHGQTIQHADATGWWPHGMTRTETARHAVGYLMSYLTKGSKEGELGEYPKHARIYGVGGLDAASARCRRWLNRPAFMQSRFDVTADVARAPGGGWLDYDTGRWWPSEFKATFPHGKLALHRVHDHGSSPLVGGPFTYLPGAQPFVH